MTLTPLIRARVLGQLSKPNLRTVLAQRIEKDARNCMLCDWAAKDLREKGKLTGAPYCWDGSEICPVDAKVTHLILEGYFSEEGYLNDYEHLSGSR